MVSEYAVNVKIQTDCEKFLFSGRYHMANTYIIENIGKVSHFIILDFTLDFILSVSHPQISRHM